jgi:hypothetical protein
MAGWVTIERVTRVLVGGFLLPADMRDKIGAALPEVLHPRLDCRFMQPYYSLKSLNRTLIKP